MSSESRWLMSEAIEQKDENKLKEILTDLQEKHGWIDFFLNEEDDQGRTPLEQVILLKELGFSKTKQAMIDLLLDKGADINRANNGGHTLLWQAIFYKQTKAVLYLLEKGVDVNKPAYGHLIGDKKWNETPLMCAVRMKNALLVKALMKAGADLDQKNYQGKTVLDLVKEEKNQKMVCLLQNEMLKGGIQKGDLLKAVQARKEDLALVLFEFDKKKVFDEKEKEEAFLLGAQYGLIKVVQCLIKAGVNKNAKDEKNENALMKSLFSSKEKMLNLLIEEGINLNERDKMGETALMKAAVIPLQVTFIQALIEAKADVNLKDKKGKTALMKAAEFGTTRSNIVYEILKAGADVNSQDEEGMSALMYGVGSEQKVVSHLLDFGADVLLKNKEGKDAYNLAMENGHPQNANLILQTLKKQLKAKKIGSHQPLGKVDLKSNRQNQ